MTKEELEKEAEEIYQKTDKDFMDCQDEGEIFNLGYLAGAEPREKRITELEKENKEAKRIIKLLVWDLRNRSYEPVKDIEQAEQFLKED